MKRTNYSSGSKWEALVGYSRAVKVGNLVEVTGTVSANADGKIIGENDAYAQTIFILQKIESVLMEAGCGLSDVIRTRMFVTDIARWEEYGKAHGEVFGDIRPCTTMVEVTALIERGFLVEIEATAFIQKE